MQAKKAFVCVIGKIKLSMRDKVFQIIGARKAGKTNSLENMSLA